MALVVEEVLEGVTATQGTTHTITLPTPTARADVWKHV